MNELLSNIKSESELHTSSNLYEIINKIYKEDVSENILRKDGDGNFIGIYPDQGLMAISNGFMENILEIFQKYKDNALIWRGKTDEEKEKEK